jgi:hypothetical protein
MSTRTTQRTTQRSTQQTAHRRRTVEHPILEPWPPKVTTERHAPLRRPRRTVVIGLLVGLTVALVAGTVVFGKLRQGGEVELTQGQVVDGLRLQERAERELLEQQLVRGYDADTARWIAQAQFYEQRRQERANAAWATRLDAQARAFRGEPLQLGDPVVNTAATARLEGLTREYFDGLTRERRIDEAARARLNGAAREYWLSLLTRGQRADALRLEGLADRVLGR